MTTQTFDKNSPSLSTLDFRNNRVLILVSYLLRVLGAILFSGLFYGAASAIHPDAKLTLKSLITVKIDAVPDIMSIILIAALVVFALWLHELIHASVFFIHTGAPPKIGVRGWMIFASAEDYLNSRNAMIVNALAPFIVISVLGLVLMFTVPIQWLAWIFIPTVANAAAAAGDFMAIHWLIRLPHFVTIEDHGDVLIAYETAK